MTLPVIDVGPLVDDGGGGGGDPSTVARQIDEASRTLGFFYVVGHRVPIAVGERLEAAARSFFEQPQDRKSQIDMSLAGRAWRGWFPIGGELTSGVPDRKEGLYFGEELGPRDPRVVAGVPLHGANLFPDEPSDLRPSVLAYLEELTTLGRRLLAGVALALGLDGGWFHRHLTADPLVLLRVFRYPPDRTAATGDWGVAEHTDYGLLTILRQDTVGGLEVRTPSGWMDVPPIPDSFVVNLGDMLDRMTSGRYRSTPHRVRPSVGVERLAFPFFFDPGWDAEVVPVPLAGEPPPDDADTRWDGTSLRHLSGTYGDYLWSKVSKVFPDQAGGLADS